MTDAEDDRTDDETIAHLLQGAECVIDIDPGSLQQRKRTLCQWMAGTDRTGPPEPKDQPTGRNHPPGARPRFIAWNRDLTLKPLNPPHEPDHDTAPTLRLAVGDHAHAAPAASSRWRPHAGWDEAAEAALSAVSELRTHLTLLRPAAQTQLLQTVLADAEDEITRTGQISARLHEQLRTALTEAPLGPALKASAGVVARLLAGD
ncbi:hypothetical protein [Streptomyces sp. NPDC058678]|uniref:hypothetical protein n=1 Tax=Streptomyces sp. NPDC058678 TaxID=3346595 RepID=UPI0036470FC1